MADAAEMTMNGDNGTVNYSLNGGNDTYSYHHNSYCQGILANYEFRKMKKQIAENLDVESLLSGSNVVRMADLGCATGPNTFTTTQTVLEAIKQKHQSQSPNSPPPQFQVFFNDLPSNDFNTLFRSLPKDRGYFAAGVPGSCNGRLFPESSLHFVYTCLCLHFLSKLPEGMKDDKSPSWNKGRVHYTSASEEVVKAYAWQFGKDMEKFLEARAKEIVCGGMLVILITGCPSGVPLASTATGIPYDLMASSLMEMAQEGLIKESEVDSFNLPLYHSASPEEMVELVDKNGCFSIERAELSEPASWLEGPVDIQQWANTMRAAFWGFFIEHFQGHIIDDMFERLTKKLLDLSDLVQERCHQKAHLFVVLKRK
ncbi:hypothetical protein UlMin_040675 [Ulmus minor]